jgi:hydroxymethylpyrimidine pyrophosphatase-like HAD family hydrolase
MKVIFIDVDGVLAPWGIRGLCPHRLNLFAALAKATGAFVVLSSTWRLPQCKEQCKRLRVELFARGVEIYDSTPELQEPIGTGLLVKSQQRGQEIQAWINAYRQVITSFVILDDDPNDEMGTLKKHLIKCDGYQGLTETQCAEITRRLNPSP